MDWKSYPEGDTPELCGTWVDFKFHPFGSLVLLQDNTDVPSEEHAGRELCVLDQDIRLRYRIPLEWCKEATFEVGWDAIYVYDGVNTIAKYDFETGERVIKQTGVGKLFLMQPLMDGLQIGRIYPPGRSTIEFLSLKQDEVRMIPEWIYPKSVYGTIQRAYVDKDKGAYVVCKPDPTPIPFRVVKHDYDGRTVWSTDIGFGDPLDVGESLGRVWVLTERGEVHVLNETDGRLLRTTKVPSPPSRWTYRIVTPVPSLVGVSASNDPDGACERAFWSTEIGTYQDATDAVAPKPLAFGADSAPFSERVCLRTDPMRGSLVLMSRFGFFALV